MGLGGNWTALWSLRSSLSGYAWAIGTTLAAAFARALLPGALAPAPYLAFYPAVVVSAALGGVGPGLAATFGALILVNFVFGNFDIADAGGMARQAIWVAASIGVSLLAGMQREARLHERRQALELRRWKDELEVRVQQRTEEIAEANTQLRGANEKLSELDHAKTDFFANVSHEFRTPLTLMLGSLQDVLGAHAGELAPDQRAQLGTAQRNSMRLLKLVNTLLDFTRIEAGCAQAMFHPVDLALATRQTASLFESAFAEAGVALSIDCAPLQERVYADAEMWEKIVLNLLSNALKFTHSGSVTVRLQAGEGCARLTVRDTGTGIPEHELPNLFQRFHRIDGAQGRSHEGSGIGLAFVKELVELHGGTISVESLVGEGSSFHVSLPFGKDHLPAERVRETQVSAGTEARAEAYVVEATGWLPNAGADNFDNLPGNGERSYAAAGSGSRARVLLADDNADMRHYVGQLLSRAGFEVTKVADGETALALCLSSPPDLVLTDVMMPKLDGFGLTARLRENEHTSLVPIILLSARAGEEARIEGLKGGADDYLVKPFGARELIARVGAAVRLAEVRKEAARREAEVTRFKASFDDAAIGMAHLAMDGRWLRVNGRLCAMMGYSSEELLTKLLGEIVHPDDRGASLEFLHRLADEPDANQSMETRFVRKNGEVIWVNLTVSLARTDEGSAGYLVCVIDDITARKKAAVELEENRSRLKGVVDSAMDAIVSVDVRQNVVLFNEAAERMFQHDAKDVIGRPLARLLPGRFEKMHGKHVDAFADTGVTNRAMGNLGALSALRSNGSEFPIEASISQTTIAGEKLFTAIVRDITERKRAEEMQGLLLAELDHRVKNALATVQAIALQTLNAHTEPAVFVESFIGRLQALGRAHGLLSQSGWRGAEIAALLTEQLTLSGVALDPRISYKGPQILLEPQAALHLGLVLHELSSNAWKFGSLSQPGGRLTTEWRLNGSTEYPRLHLKWLESDGPPPVAPTKRGFGTTLIERSLCYALGGRAVLDFKSTGLTCDIWLPLPETGQGAYGVKPVGTAS